MHTLQDVVIIEDSASVLRLVSRYFERRGAHVTSAHEAPTGIELIRRLHPDLVVCDHSVKQGDGLRVLRAVKEDAATASIPFIYTSSDVSAPVREAALRHGADSFVEKPFTSKDITEAIAEALSNQGTSEDR